jgi:hypothetical protein
LLEAVEQRMSAALIAPAGTGKTACYRPGHVRVRHSRPTRVRNGRLGEQCRIFRNDSRLT